MSTILTAALALAAKGWPVFPCSPANKAPLLPKETSPGAKDGGLYLASTDERQIRAWWEKWPKAMIGMPTGARSGCFVIDLDPKKHSADAMLRSLSDWLGVGVLPPCPVSRTQSGGLHLLFQLANEHLGNRAGLFRHIADAPDVIREHVDTRGEGGYIIVPPSVMASGAAYVWEQDPADHDLPPLPAKLVDAVAKRLDDKGRGTGDAGKPASRPPAPLSDDERVNENRRKYALAALDRTISNLSRVSEGARGFELNKEAYSLGALVAAGILSEAMAIAGLEEACRSNGLWNKDGPRLCHDNMVRALHDGFENKLDLSQIGTRLGPSRNNARLAGASRPPDSSQADSSQGPSPPSSSASPAPLDHASRGFVSQSGATGAEHCAAGGGGESPEAAARRKESWRWRVNLACSRLPQTDLGNAQRLIERYGRNFLFVAQWGWLAWDGRRWNAKDADAILNRAIHATIKAIAGEASMLRRMSDCFDRDPELIVRLDRFTSGDQAVDDDGEAYEPLFWNPVVDYKKREGKITTAADRLSQWCLSSQSNAHVSCVANLAKAYLTASPDDFDVDPMAFNVANGTLRFKRTTDGSPYVRFTRHAREDKLTKLSEVVYDPVAQCPVYDAFLAKVQPDPDMRRHLHAWGGVSLTGETLARMAFWYGKGRNGKSTCIDAWAHVIGEYGQTIPIESFLDQGRARRGGEASPDIASLVGVRLLRTSEPEKGAQLAESLVKLVTGGEPLRARHLNRDFFEFRPKFKLTMQGNYRPNVVGTDEGFWRRMLLVPWSVTIAEHEIDPLLPDKLKAEVSGILNRLLDGLCDYLDNGISPTAEIIQATESYRSDSDPVGRFLKECTVNLTLCAAPVLTVGAGEDAKSVWAEWHEAKKKPDGTRQFQARVTGKELYALYSAWAKADGEKVWTNKGFGRSLLDHGIVRFKSSGVFYLNLGLTAKVEDFEGQEIENDVPNRK